jgi:sugar phosphate permease
LDATEPAATDQQRGRAGLHWVNGAVVAVLAACVGATIVLTATDVGVVAALRDMGHQSWIGWELTLWGLGSALGGLVYGALHRPIPTGVLLALLAVTTLPLAVSTDALTMAALLVVAGFFCAPTLTATVDTLSRTVPENVRGEALGWHGSALTAGGAIGAPLAGVVIDHWDWPAGFTVPALLSLLAALVLLVVSPAGRPREVAAGV